MRSIYVYCWKKVITVFRSDPSYLKQGLTDTKAPIAKFCGKGCYPFLALADHDGSAASLFRIERHRSFLAAVKELCSYLSKKRNLSKMTTTAPKGTMFSGAKRPATFLPSEFLIDERGIIIDALLAEKAADMASSSMNERIAHFLLFGTKKDNNNPQASK